MKFDNAWKPRRPVHGMNKKCQLFLLLLLNVRILHEQKAERGNCWLPVRLSDSKSCPHWIGHSRRWLACIQAELGFPNCQGCGRRGYCVRRRAGQTCFTGFSSSALPIPSSSRGTTAGMAVTFPVAPCVLASASCPTDVFPLSPAKSLQ